MIIRLEFGNHIHTQLSPSAPVKMPTDGKNIKLISAPLLYMGRLCLPRHVTRNKPLALILLALVLFSGFGYRTLNSQTQTYLHPVAPPAHVLALGHPTFEDVREYERTLPQHRMSSFSAKNRPRCVCQSSPSLGSERSRGRYLFFPWEAWGTG